MANLWSYVYGTQVYLEPNQISTMKIFVKTVSGWKPLTNFAKSSILDFWMGSKYASVNYMEEVKQTPYLVAVRLHWVR